MALSFDEATGEQNPSCIEVTGVKLKRKSEKWVPIRGLTLKAVNPCLFFWAN